MAKTIAITKGVTMLAGVVSRQYLVDSGDGLILIDAGLFGNLGNVLAALARMGRTPGELDHILITHADPDHYGAAYEIASVSGADIYASQIEAEAMRAGRSSRKLQPRGLERLFYGLAAPMMRSQPTPVDTILCEGDRVGNLTVVASPGHTPAHISFYLADQNVLFAGDSIQIRGGQPVASAGGNTWDADMARHTYRKQMELLGGSGHVCCGHGYCRFERGEGD